MRGAGNGDGSRGEAEAPLYCREIIGQRFLIYSAWPKNTILPIGGVDPTEQAFLNKRYFRELKLFYFGIPVFLRAPFFLDTPLPSYFRIGSRSWVQAAFL